MKSDGFSLVEAIVVSAVFCIVMLSIAALNSQLAKLQSQTASFTQLSVYQGNLITLIKNPASWDRTTTLNSSMNCLTPGSTQTCVDPTTGQPYANQYFAIYDASTSNTPFYDSTNGTTGLTQLATICHNYAVIDPTQSPCPFRFELQWSALCNPANCQPPNVQVQITGNLLFTPPPSMHLMTFNTTLYSVPPIIRSAQ